MTFTKSILIRIIHDSKQKDGTTDDKLYIKKTGVNKYTLRYEEHGLPEYHTLSLTEDEVLHYIDNMFVLMSHDASPFPFIQIDFPCFPIVQYKPGQLTNSEIKNAVKNCLKLLSSVNAVRN